jgi:Spy/CpxP family protein refolding chaperone
MRAKSIISIIVAAAAITATTQGQAATPDQPPAQSVPPTPPNSRPGVQQPARPGDPVDRLGQELNLSADQKAKMQNVFRDTRERIQTAIQQAMTNADAEMHRILTPEQYQKLQSLESQHEPPHSQDGASRNPKPNPENVK